MKANTVANAEMFEYDGLLNNLEYKATYSDGSSKMVVFRYPKPSAVDHMIGVVITGNEVVTALIWYGNSVYTPLESGGWKPMPLMEEESIGITNKHLFAGNALVSFLSPS